MGTRADFYVGRGPTAEWLGSIGWDGYPAGGFAEGSDDHLPPAISDEQWWRTAVSEWLGKRGDSTTPDQGWPWPWDDSRTTDYAYAYAYDEGLIWGSCFGRSWFPAANEPDDSCEGEKVAAFPDMSSRRNVRWDGGSGLIVLG